MPVAPTYPGVYIEEVPSGVRTITGVSTSVTAFIGYTTRGPENVGVRVVSYGDFERGFGGLDPASPVSYAVKQFFQNGGSEAVVVRVAHNAEKASVNLLTAAGGTHVLTVAATSEGAWGNLLRLDVDYATINPADLFNLTVAELVDSGGTLVVGRSERFANLSMSSLDPAYVVPRVNGVSELIRVERATGLTWTQGSSTSGTLSEADFNALDATHRQLSVSVNGGAPVPVTLFTAAPSELFVAADDDLNERIDKLATVIATQVNAALGAGTITAARSGSTLLVQTAAATPTERSSVRFVRAAANDASATLRLGIANGGTEAGGTAARRPMQTGTVGAVLANPIPAAAIGTLDVNVVRASGTTAVAIPITAAGANPTRTEVLAAIQNAINTNPALAGATATIAADRIRLLPPPQEAGVRYEIPDADTVGSALGLNLSAAAENVARYAPGTTAIAQGSGGGVAGSDGTPPELSDLEGIEADKTGIYALENVDLFNLLVLPGVTDKGVLAKALAYAELRRAFLLVDLPVTVDSVAEAQAWLNDTGASLRSRNAAAYFPWYREPDPLLGNVVQPFPPSGALAGLFARTDAERGVWKAPAGTDANLRGAVGLTATLTDRENGVLNPQGLNVLRTFPTIGTVVWGARTLRGADLFADEYKYVPVRRLALYIEESLYRGTQWVVFEPNDEPLWSQIRLNVGAFMQTLFRQGAFQGRSPREAYFVKCDRETNPQADVDRGIVNVAVGFAPLKPAEFVILRIQQIAPSPL